jgi:hypothetical protein
MKTMRIAALLACIAASLATSAFAQRTMLKHGEFLKTYEYLVADNKAFFAVMQGDGNFCVYRGSGPADPKGLAYCTRNTSAGSGLYFATLQGDGNFCIYRGTGPGDNKGFVDCTSSASGAGQYFAIMQGDGNFAVYRGTGPGDNKGLVWDSMHPGSGSGGAKAFFVDVGDWLKGAGNTIAAPFQGKLKAEISNSTVQVGGAAAELSVTGKPTIRQGNSKGTGAVRIDSAGALDGEFVDVVNRRMKYRVTGTQAGPVTLVFSNEGSSTEVGMTVLAAPPPSPQFTRVAAGRSYLTTNQFMREGDFLVADNRSHFAMMQGDGNFCVYRGSSPSDNKGNIYCRPGKGSGGGAYYAAVQSDGNFCIYRGTGPDDNKGVISCSNSAGFPGAYFLIMQGDGNLVVYRGTGPGDNKGLVWQK